MKVIPFPAAAQLNAKARNGLRYDKPSNSADRLCLDEISFTCPYCRTINQFSVKNLIFRSLEFYCASCGNFHRVVNPAFGGERKSGSR